MLTERNLCWVAGVGQSNLLAINHQGITISLHSSIVLAMNSVLSMTNMLVTPHVRLQVPKEPNSAGITHTHTHTRQKLHQITTQTSMVVKALVLLVWCHLISCKTKSVHLRSKILASHKKPRSILHPHLASDSRNHLPLLMIYKP